MANLTPATDKELNDILEAMGPQHANDIKTIWEKLATTSERPLTTTEKLFVIDLVGITAATIGNPVAKMCAMFLMNSATRMMRFPPMESISASQIPDHLSL